MLNTPVTLGSPHDSDQDLKKKAAQSKAQKSKKKQPPPSSTCPRKTALEELTKLSNTETASHKLETKSMEFYISMLFNYLYYNSDSQNEVEIYYTDLRKQNVSLFRYRNYKENGLTIPNFTFQKLLCVLQPPRVLDILRIIMLERKLVLIHNDYTVNAVLIESLLSLLSPL